MKYIQNVNFEDRANVTLYSPTTTLVVDDGQSKLLVKEIEGVDTEMKIVGDRLEDLEVEKKPQGETWYFNEVVEENPFDKDYYCNFISNNEKFIRILNSNFLHLFILGYYRNESELPIEIFNEGKGIEAHWTDEAYRTIILEQPATGDLLTFLQTNATKIS